MEKIVECVPNVSEGRNAAVYEAIAKSCEKVSGVKLLDIDPGAATNRTVITFAGSPEVIVDAAFEVIKAAREMIDMRQHKGEHPRMGACDVCPFVPISGVTLDDCAILAKELAKRVGEELGVWAYLYEHAASKPEWKSLSNVRKGEYESLVQRQGNPAWRPDYGPIELDPRFGAVAIGARKVLVAYNINMNSSNKKWAQDIAMNIRESGRAKRESYPDGEILRHADGTAINIPGVFSHCKSTAWVIPEYNRAQVTMNLTDVDVTPLHVVFDEVMKQAFERGTRVTGSEIVGLVPLNVLLDAGRHFLRKQGLTTAVSEKDLVQNAIMSLGLNDVVPFHPEDKIIEYKLRGLAKKAPLLVDQTLLEFADTLASDAPAPGGGSIAALCGTLAASLGTMVTSLTHGKIKYKEHWEQMEHMGIRGQELKEWFLKAVDKDTDAFNAIMDATRLPKDNEAQNKARERAMLAANKEAALVPLSVLEKAVDTLPVLDCVAHFGNSNCASDVGVGVWCLRTCAEGAAMNVRINLKNVSDESFRQDSLQRIELALSRVRHACDNLLLLVNKSL